MLYWDATAMRFLKRRESVPLSYRVGARTQAGEHGVVLRRPN